jgi:DNA-binding response OmpR family regulator
MARPKKKILLISSEQRSASVINFTLRTNGYAVIPASTAAEALEIFRAGGIDLLLCEWPVDGLCRVLNACRDLDPGIHSIVIATGMGEADPMFFADAILRDHLSSAELLAWTKILSGRKRGPRPMSPKKPPRLASGDIAAATSAFDDSRRYA